MRRLKSIPALMLCVILCSCTVFREETAVGIYAPEINPEPVEGAMEQMTLQLYFPMANEPYMCSQTRVKEVSVSASIESVLLAQLLEEGPTGESTTAPTDLTSVLDSRTKYSVSRKGTVIEVTLSKDFLNRIGLVDETAEKQRRMLSIYCIVNTLTMEDRSLSVQILIDEDGNARKPRYDEVGILPPTVGSNTLEPLSFTSDRILTLVTATRNILDAAATRDAEKLHKYLLIDNRPSVEELQNTLHNVYGLVGNYNINNDSESTDKKSGSVNVELTLFTRQSEPVNQSRTIPFVKEGDVWKVDYRSLENLIFIKTEPPAPITTGDQPTD